jgi:hypothetical protein
VGFGRHGERALGETHPALLWKIPLTYGVPYMVSTYGVGVVSEQKHLLVHG